jgi:hypothetical protein
MNYFHPFHIHVNPFKVMDMYSGNVPGSIANKSLLEAVKDTKLMPSGMWRDTVFIPPFGYTIIQSRFGESKAWTGKTVYHCHFLDHEDQGMIAAMIIADPGNPSTQAAPATPLEGPTEAPKEIPNGPVEGGADNDTSAAKDLVHALTFLVVTIFGTLIGVVV